VDFVIDIRGDREFRQALVSVLFVLLKGDGAFPLLPADPQHVLGGIGLQGHAAQKKLIVGTAHRTLDGHRIQVLLQPVAIGFQRGDRFFGGGVKRAWVAAREHRRNLGLHLRQVRAYPTQRLDREFRKGTHRVQIGFGALQDRGNFLHTRANDAAALGVEGRGLD
jgi:hypothetical protein